jgi:hypothetical protein
MFQMDGRGDYGPVEELDPDRLEILRIYKELPKPMHHILCKVALVLEKSIPLDEQEKLFQSNQSPSSPMSPKNLAHEHSTYSL